MTKTEVGTVLSIMKAAYPATYRNMTNEEAINIIELWNVVFLKDEFEKVNEAVIKLITELKFPPTIAEIKEEIKPKLFYPEE